MYKAIKDNKIIAISDIGNEFSCLIKDEVVEDTEHTIDDYGLYYYEEDRAEYLLKSEIPAPTKKEQQAKRKLAYEQEIDELHSQKMRHQVLGDWTEEDEAEYIEKVRVLSAEIVERYPYPEDSIFDEESE